jgi:hypothetical protein
MEAGEDALLFIRLNDHVNLFLNFPVIKLYFMIYVEETSGINTIRLIPFWMASTSVRGSSEQKKRECLFGFNWPGSIWSYCLTPHPKITQFDFFK